MAISVTAQAATDEELMRGLFMALNCPHPRKWSGAPGEDYEWHAHAYDKILFVIEGSITFNDREFMNYRLERGDRIDIPAGTEHHGVAGVEGVTCLESFR